MSFIRRSFAAAAVLFAAVGACFAIPAYQATTLRAINDGAFAVSISDSGQVLGWAGDLQYQSSEQQRAIIWDSPTQLHDLGSWSPQAINDKGAAIGWGYDADVALHAFKWTPSGGLKDLGLLNNDITGDSYALGINGAGVVVGTSAVGVLNDLPDRQPCYWDTSNTIHALANLPGQGWGMAQAINDAGTIVGYSGGMACRWDAAGSPSLLAQPDSDWSSAIAITNSGLIVGNFYHTAADTYHACYWDPSGAVHDLGDWEAYGINDLGLIAGCVYDQAGNPHACVADLQGNVTLLDPSGNIGGALGINSSGAIAGYTYSNLTNSYVATVWTPVPEPPGLLGMLGGLLAAGGLLRFRRR